jgi:hypothetical protein
MRHPATVANDLIVFMPEDAKPNMKYFVELFMKQPVDRIESCWEVLQTFLFKIIGPVPEEDWHMEALAVFSDTSIDEVRVFAKELQAKAEMIEKDDDCTDITCDGGE